jgi:putative ABC transport system ATP-binding protein
MMLTNDTHSFLELKSLTKSYIEGQSQRHVLRNASLKLAKGQFIAIVGKSGSGKTTLLNLISGIDQADEGTIWLNGENLTSLDDHQRTLFRRKNIGFIFQFFNLIPTLSVWENITLPLELNGKANQEGLMQADSLLAEIGLADRRKAFPDQLSGGEQQRVALARALVHNPFLVLADEPTGNLDEDTGRQVMALLDRLTRQSGKNLVLVTHSPEIAGFADRILLLHEGQFEEQAT